MVLHPATTGLVSLNVHEPLTFEAEIVLHPDLFGGGGIGTGIGIGNDHHHHHHGVGGAITNVGSSSFSGTVAGGGARIGSQQQQQQPRDSRTLPAVPTASSEDKLTVHSSPPPLLLQAGDLIEIKVWDPLPRAVLSSSSPDNAAAVASTTNRSNVNAVLRRRSSPPASQQLLAGHPLRPASGQSSTCSSIPNFTTSAVSSSGQHPPPSVNNVLQQAATNLLNLTTVTPPTTLSTAHSMQYSETTATTSHLPPHPPTASQGGASLANAPSEESSTGIIFVGSPGTEGDDRSVSSSGDRARSIQNLESAATTPMVSPKSCLTDDPSSSTARQQQQPTTTTTTTTPPPSSSDALPPVFPRALISQANSSVGVSSALSVDGPVPPATTNPPGGGTATATLPPKPPALSGAARRNTIGNPPFSSPTAADPGLLYSAPSSASKLISSSSSSVAAAARAATTAVAAAASTTSHQLPAATSSLRPRHFRDLSDMTLDTVYDSATKTLHLDGSHQLTGELLQVPLSSAAGMTTRSTATTVGTIGGAAGLLQNKPVTMLVASSARDLGAATTDDEEDGGTSLSHLSSTHRERLSFVMKVGEQSLTSLKGSARTQVSLLRPIADLYGLSSYDPVTIRKIDPSEEKSCLESCRADYVLVTIKDQFISRGEMHSFLQDALVGSWVYEGQRLFEAGRSIQAHARQIRHQDLMVPSGIITEDTKITFRSRSARFVWLVQMSSEMWDYSSPYERNQSECHCETYFDKWISFVRRLFDKWKEAEVTHSLTVVFFSRTFVGESPPIWYATNQRRNSTPTKDHDIYGRQFEDHFRIVIENETSSDWETLIVRLKEAFVRYPHEVGWNVSSGAEARRPSSASQGNVMEAVNVTLNLLQYHYLDRDLHRTGNSIVIISAGNGVFEVDKGLAAITYERMMVNGIGSDMLSLALPPLHTAPFFLYVNDRTNNAGGSLNFGGTYYEVPHWMHLSFVNYESEERFVAADVSLRSEEATPSFPEIDGRPLFPNGFLLPRKKGRNHDRGEVSGASPQIRPAVAPSSTAVKPTKVTPQERQLISGRDFNDILEACRPRNSAILPSALKAVLQLYHPLDTHVTCETDATAESTDDMPEWGSIENDSITNSPTLHSHHRRVVALGQEPGVDLSPGFGPLPAPEGSPDGELLEKGSAASSYASQHSSGIGVSYDRPFVSNKGSPSLTGVQVQKSTSLDFHFDDDIDQTSESDNSESGSSAGSSFERRRVDREKRQTEKFIASLKQKMREYNAKLVVETPKVNPPPEDTKPQAPASFGVSSLSRHGGQWSSKPTGSGGIGAALSQYRSVSAKSGPLAPESVESHSSVSRVASATVLSSMAQTKIRLPEMGSRGMSPLFLPPVVLSSSEIPSISSRRRPMEQRLVHPSELSRSGLESLSRLTGQRATSSGFSRSPPLVSSPGIAMSMMSSSSLPGQRSLGPRSSSQASKSRRNRQKKAFNPFRQQDEDEVLAKKSHNRRRWSHVFPLGEVEFKRHAGPNWKSLSSPAILPLFVDYFPSQQEIDHNFTFNYYNIILSHFENSPYSSTKDFLMEMVRQRLTQDYQLVPLSHIDASNYRRLISDNEATANVTSQFLSMGHRLQVLTYDHSADVIQVMIYDAKTIRETSGYMYHYRCFCQETQSYATVVQTFSKFADHYNWGKVDRIICGDKNRDLLEGMRFKRLMFAVIPDRFENVADEAQFVAKFQRLLEYLNKLRDRGDDSKDQLDVKIVTSADRHRELSVPVSSTVGVEGGMHRFYARLRKGKQDKLEWMEVVVDKTLNTLWSYRIMFHWLVAGSAKIENQVQLLQRRCSQFGLVIVPIPQISVSRSIYVGPFKAPAIIAIRDSEKAAHLDNLLADLDFLHDGVFYTDARVVASECLDNGRDFDFGRSQSALGRQFLHRSGTLFVRVLTDLRGLVLVAVLGNYLYTSKDPRLRDVAQTLYQQLAERIDGLSKENTYATDTTADSPRLSTS